MFDFVGRWRAAIVPTLLFLLVFGVHVTSRVITSFDSGWAVYVSRSIVREGNVSLNEYAPQIRAKRLHGIRKIDGKFYNFFPVGTSLVAAPVVALFEAAPSYVVTWLPGFPRAAKLLVENGKVPTAANAHLEMERAAASVIVAVTAIVLFFTAKYFLSIPGALLVAMIFSFCTPAWSTGSRALWPHAPTMMLLSLAVYLLVAASRRPYLAQFAALPLGFSFVVRPSNITSIVVLTVYVLLVYRQFFWRYVVWGSLIALGFAWFNYDIHGTVIPKYYQPSRVHSHPNFYEAFLANLFSPSRGLFVFAPVFLLSTFALFRRNVLGDRRLAFALALIIVLHTYLISSFPNWWGGHAYGPRYMSDMVPYFVVLLIPYVAMITESKQHWVPATVMLVLLVPSFALNKIGATRWSTLSWNVIPNNIDDDQSRVWDWSDPQFLRLSNSR